MGSSDDALTSIEICAGAGGQAIGLHEAGFRHLALVEIDKHACETLRENVRLRKSEWGDPEKVVVEMDVKEYGKSRELAALELPSGGPDSLDLLAGGVPCPPFSHAGKQLGQDDDRDLFPTMLRLVDQLSPKAVMIENVRGIMDPKFTVYREALEAELGGRGETAVEGSLGYRVCGWEVLEASKFGVPQLRPRAILVAIRRDILGDLKFFWPEATHEQPVSVATALDASMVDRFEDFKDEGGLQALEAWRAEALKQAVREGGNGGIAPTLVGGSKKHGGADLGPSRAKAAWKLLGVCGLGVANDQNQVKEKKTQKRDLLGADGPMLNVEQAAIIQGFPAAPRRWDFTGGKTAQYRQVGNAFPPPVAAAVGSSIASVLLQARKRDKVSQLAKKRSSVRGIEVAAASDRSDDLESAGV